MAYSITLPLQLPNPITAGHGEIISSDSSGERGANVTFRAIQTIYGASKLAWVIQDLSATGVLGSNAEAYYWQSKTPRFDSSNLTCDIWLYVVRSVAQGGGNTWSVTFYNDTSGLNTGAMIVNGGAITTGTWWLAGTIATSEANDWNLWHIESARGGVAPGLIYGICVVPRRNRAAVSNRVGGYSNNVQPIDLTYVGQNNNYLTNVAMLEAHGMAVGIFKRNSNIMTSGFYQRTTVGLYADASAGYYLYDRIWAVKPSSCLNLFVRARGAGVNGTLRAYLSRGLGNEALTSGAITGTNWTNLTVFAGDKIAQSPHEIQVVADVGLSSVACAWADSVYG